jgi:hypothetical protein
MSINCRSFPDCRTSGGLSSFTTATARRFITSPSRTMADAKQPESLLTESINSTKPSIWSMIAKNTTQMSRSDEPRCGKMASSRLSHGEARCQPRGWSPRSTKAGESRASPSAAAAGQSQVRRVLDGFSRSVLQSFESNNYFDKPVSLVPSRPVRISVRDHRFLYLRACRSSSEYSELIRKFRIFLELICR